MTLEDLLRLWPLITSLLGAIGTMLGAGLWLLRNMMRDQDRKRHVLRSDLTVALGKIEFAVEKRHGELRDDMRELRTAVMDAVLGRRRPHEGGQ